MPFCCTYLPYRSAGSFSPLVLDYLSGSEALKSFYSFSPDKAGIEKAIEERKKFPVNRKLLADILKNQYEKLNPREKALQNIALLQKENTFTICTAHQPNLLTGYLYFVYKIVHAIKLSEVLSSQFPDYHFVPVYYMGSEDNDLDELGAFRFNGEKFRWDASGQKGAVGRMNPESLKPLLDALFRQMGPPGPNCEALKHLISTAYLGHKDISDATQYLVHELFGRFGLIVLNPDEPELKRAFSDVMKDDLLNHTAEKIVSRQMNRLSANYKTQAFPRPINLFYLKDQIRERIERQERGFSVVNTNICFSETELLEELEKHPERFSPNVILRGLFQESILPDVVFIGGGSEVAYWMQLNALFDHYKVFFPAVLLRQSVLWISENENKLRMQAGLSLEDLFKPETELEENLVFSHFGDGWKPDEELEQLEHVLGSLKQKAVKLDPSLGRSSEAVLTKIRYQILILEKKMVRAGKRKKQVEISRIGKLKKQLFPGGGLQERVENFLPFFLRLGADYFDILKEKTDPLRNQFLIIAEERS